MSSTHIVSAGECLSSIAATARRPFRNLWQDPHNSELRGVRPNPNCLLPGDPVTIPDKLQKVVQVSTGASHTFKLRAEATLLRVRTLAQGAPRRNVDYTLEIDGTSTAGQTDSKGCIQIPIPGDALQGKLKVRRDEFEETYLLDLGTLGPVHEVLGIQGRLANLGYPVSALDGVSGNITGHVIRRFQKKYGLTVTGAPDEATYALLQDLHDDGGEVAMGPPIEALKEHERFDIRYPGDLINAHEAGAEAAAEDGALTFRRPAMRTAPGFSHMNTLDLRPLPALLEVEDTTYHLNSAVTLPVLPTFGPPDPVVPSAFMDSFTARCRQSHPAVFYDYWKRTVEDDPPEEELWRRSSLVHIAVIYLFLQTNPEYRLLLAGHTDSTGGDAFNMELGQERAENFYCLLTGERGRWIDNCIARSTVEDYQRILSYYATLYGMSCDPGEVDNQCGEQTTQAIRGFQQDYNTRFQKRISVDGFVGAEVWGAFFDMYMLEIATLLGTTSADLGTYRSYVRFVDRAHPTISCGERIPIEEPLRKHFRSQKNRRVESLFFPSSDLPDLKAHLKGGAIRSGSAGREASPIYGPGADPFAIIIPRWWNEVHETGRTPQFQIEEMVPIETESEESSLPVVRTEADDADPWAYLDRFEETEPPYFDPDEMNERWDTEVWSLG